MRSMLHVFFFDTALPNGIPTCFFFCKQQASHIPNVYNSREPESTDTMTRKTPTAMKLDESWRKNEIVLDSANKLIRRINKIQSWFLWVKPQNLRKRKSVSKLTQRYSEKPSYSIGNKNGQRITKYRNPAIILHCHS